MSTPREYTAGRRTGCSPLSVYPEVATGVRRFRLLPNGPEVSTEEYYAFLTTQARAQQAKFPWWHSARRRWKRLERQWRALSGNAVGATR